MVDTSVDNIRRLGSDNLCRSSRQLFDGSSDLVDVVVIQDDYWLRRPEQFTELRWRHDLKSRRRHESPLPHGIDIDTAEWLM